MSVTCPSHYPPVPGSGEGCQEIQFLFVICDNISLHTVLLAVLKILGGFFSFALLSSLPTHSPNSSVDHSGGGVGERRWGHGVGGTWRSSDSTKLSRNLLQHCLIRSSETYLAESAAELHVADSLPVGCEK